MFQVGIILRPMSGILVSCTTSIRRNFLASQYSVSLSLHRRSEGDARHGGTVTGGGQGGRGAAGRKNPGSDHHFRFVQMESPSSTDPAQTSITGWSGLEIYSQGPGTGQSGYARPHRTKLPYGKSFHTNSDVITLLRRDKTSVGVKQGKEPALPLGQVELHGAGGLLSVVFRNTGQNRCMFMDRVFFKGLF